MRNSGYQLRSWWQWHTPWIPNLHLGEGACPAPGVVTGEYLKGSPLYSPTDFFQPLVFIIHPVVLGCLFVMYQSPVIVNPNKPLTFKIKLYQVLSIATLLIDSTLLITLREHPNWVYNANQVGNIGSLPANSFWRAESLGIHRSLTSLKILGLWKLFNEFLLTFSCSKGEFWSLHC